MTALEKGGVTRVQDGAVVTVTLNRPENRNAMRPSTWAALAAVGASIGDDVRVVVLRGAGEAFSAGLDLRLFSGERIGDDAPITDLFTATQEEFDRAVATYQEGFSWLRDPNFISVAAVQGYAIGAGFQLALACDIRIATDDAKFSMREPTLGIIPDLTGTKHLVEAVGYSRALEWTATARFIGAEEALASGLVNQVVSRDMVDPAIAELVNGLIAHPHGAVTATKSLLLGAVERGFEEQRAAEREAQFHRFAALAAKLNQSKTLRRPLGPSANSASSNSVSSAIPSPSAKPRTQRTKASPARMGSSLIGTTSCRWLWWMSYRGAGRSAVNASTTMPTTRSTGSRECRAGRTPSVWRSRASTPNLLAE
ncbi:enoyl-CoA hydratase/isomerase family protein [Arthrobacter sp. ISL-72]|nr:enoyl-CoA hydratase/isomerase family protein [Arthrobacter sp. ISL-72]